MRKSRTIAFAFLATLIALPAFAQQPETLSRARLAASLDTRFKMLDGNANGWFDRAEYLAARSKAEQAASKMLTAMLTKEFLQLDSNKDGSLTAAEIDGKVQKGAPGKATVTRLDANKDQKISLAEYRAQTSGVKATGNVEQQLKGWDKDGNGRITLQEYKGGALDRFDSLDGNKDGTLTGAEMAAGNKRAPAGR